MEQQPVNERERRRRSLLQLLAVIFIMSLLFDLFPSGGSRTASSPAQPGSPDKGPEQSAAALAHIVDSISGAVRGGADLSAVYPANISSFFQGEWERQEGPAPVAGRRDPVAAHLLNFRWSSLSPASFPLRQTSGVTMQQLFSRPTRVPGVHLVQGFLAMRDGRERTSHDEVFAVKGLYFRSFGRVSLFANAKGSRLGVAWAFRRSHQVVNGTARNILTFNATTAASLLPGYVAEAGSGGGSAGARRRRLLRGAPAGAVGGPAADERRHGNVPPLAVVEGRRGTLLNPWTLAHRVREATAQHAAEHAAAGDGVEAAATAPPDASEAALFAEAQRAEEDAVRAAGERAGGGPSIPAGSAAEGGRRLLSESRAAPASCGYILRLEVDPLERRPPHAAAGADGDGDGEGNGDEIGDGPVVGAGPVQQLRLKGLVVSPNCGVVANITVGGVRAAPSYLSAKANGYGAMVIVTSIAQLVAQGVQMSRSGTQSMAQRLSTAGIGMLAIIDSYMCLVHLTVGVMKAEIFATFAGAAFLEMLLFSVFGMRLLLMAWKAQNPDAFTGGIDVLRRRLGALYTRFYCSMILGMVLMYNFSGYDIFIPLVVFCSLSFFVPQIAFSARHNYRHALHPGYVIATGATRLAIPLYLLACPESLPHVLLGTQLRPGLAVAACAYVGLQVLLVLSQSRVKPRWFVPRSLLPETYNYERTLPRAVLQRLAHQGHGEGPGADAGGDDQARIGDGGEGGGDGAGDGAGPGGDDAEPSRSDRARFSLSQIPAALQGARARMAGYASVPTRGHGPDRGDDGVELAGRGTGADAVGDVEQGGVVATTCVICMDTLHVAPGEYMVTPCDHVFHADCLRRWMSVKLECPTCRAVIPPHEDEDDGAM